MFDHALKMLLWGLGFGVSIGSRVLPSVRSQITRSLVFEISAGDHVVRQWRFDGTSRHAVSVAQRVHEPDGALHFDSSRLALRRLLSVNAVDGIVDDWHYGRARVDGSATLLLWFHGLIRRLVKIGAAPGPAKPLPHAYIRHDPASCGGEAIVIEPAVDQLDPGWLGAWQARATLPNVRAMTGEPVTG